MWMLTSFSERPTKPVIGSVCSVQRKNSLIAPWLLAWRAGQEIDAVDRIVRTVATSSSAVQASGAVAFEAAGDAAARTTERGLRYVLQKIAEQAIAVMMALLFPVPIRRQTLATSAFQRHPPCPEQLNSTAVQCTLIGRSWSDMLAAVALPLYSP